MENWVAIVVLSACKGKTTTYLLMKKQEVFLCVFLLPLENNGIGRGVNNNLSQNLVAGTWQLLSSSWCLEVPRSVPRESLGAGRDTGQLHSRKLGQPGEHHALTVPRDLQSEVCVGDVQSAPRTVGKLTWFHCNIFNEERDWGRKELGVDLNWHKGIYRKKKLQNCS